jgi:hypothetical protein
MVSASFEVTNDERLTIALTATAQQPTSILLHHFYAYTLEQSLANNVTLFNSDVLAYTDYDPFGMLIPIGFIKLPKEKRLFLSQNNAKKCCIAALRKIFLKQLWLKNIFLLGDFIYPSGINRTNMMKRGITATASKAKNKTMKLKAKETP